MVGPLLMVLGAAAAVGADPARLRAPRAVGHVLTKPAANNSCFCVPFYNCEDGQIITDGAGLLNPRFGPSEECLDDFNQCCQDNEKIMKIEAKPGINKSVMTSIKDSFSDLFGGDGGSSRVQTGADKCFCVAFYLCDGNVLAPGVAEQVDYRQLSTTGRCDHSNQVCCPLPKPKVAVGPACNCTGRQYCNQRDIQPLRVGQAACGSHEVCCSNPQPATTNPSTHGGGSGSVVPDTAKPDYDLWKFCKSYPFSVACVRSRQINSQPTLRPAPAFNPAEDSRELNEAIGYFDATDDVLIDILTHRTFEQRYLISTSYERITGNDLHKAISRTTRGHFDDLMVALTRNANYYDYLAEELYDSMHRVGTDEDTVLETLISSTSEEIDIIKRHYRSLKGSDLIDDIKSDFSGDLEDILVALVNGSRDNSFRISRERAIQQAESLRQAGENRLGTDEETFKYYLTHENYAQLALIFSEYEQLTHTTFSEALDNEFTDDVEDATKAIVEVTKNLPRFLARRLHHALWGRLVSKDDSSLIRIIVSRAEIDLATIAAEYQSLYGRTLLEDVQLKSTGDYDTALSHLLGDH